MQLTAIALKPLFSQWAAIMQSEKEQLIELDSVVGDGDLGLTMSDGFTAANLAVQDSNEQDIGKLFYVAGKTMMNAVPSTMGTLMASGLMQVGKTFKDRPSIDSTEFGELFLAYFNGVQARGKAQIGEKTFLDGLYPAVQTLIAAYQTEAWDILANQALASAQMGMMNTTHMLAIHGRAATRGEQSRTLLDPGAYVAMLLLRGYANFAQQLCICNK
ncbi:dihydroxyacetone kinase subunit L [Orbus mooreae]|uniref:dihydroxyacetone kinase subunit L n=1 Tax=Orbus mooreae TaxID=3074107 RepID=UPI00370D34D0